MVNKFFVSNNHCSLVTSKLSTINKTFYLIKQLLLLICLPNVNITRLTASKDVAPIKLIPDWFFGGIKPIFSIVRKKRFSGNFSCEFLVNKTTSHAPCEFFKYDLYLAPTIELPYYGDIDIRIIWESKEQHKDILIDLERRLEPNFISINFPPIYCCIKGPNLTFTGSNFYSLFQPLIRSKSIRGTKLCTALNNYTLTCNRPLFENATEKAFNFYIFSHYVPVSGLGSLIIEPLPHFIWVISRPQLSVIIEPKWVEFVDPVIIKVYKSSGDLLVECIVQVDLQSNWLTCDKSTPIEEPSTLSCVVTFGTETIPATANTTDPSHITIPTITEVTTVTTQSDDADSNGSPITTIIIILVVLILIFLVWAVFLFHVYKLLTSKLSLASSSTLSSISRIPYFTVTSKATHELSKFTSSTLSSEQVSSRSGKNFKKKGGPPTK